MTGRLCPQCRGLLSVEHVGPKSVPVDFCHRCDLVVPESAQRARHLAAVPDPRVKDEERTDDR